MKSYTYYAVSPSGKKRRGIIEAENSETARSLLKKRGETVISIEEAGIFEQEIHLPFPAPKIRAKELRVYCRQMVALIGADVGIYRSFRALGEQTEEPVGKKTFQKIADSLERGMSLTVSVESCGNVFPPIFLYLIRAGEEAGSLDRAFERMAVYCEKQEKLRNAVRKALVYPIILSVVVFIIIVAMLLYIIPMYGNLFEEMGTELPLYTRAVLGAGQFMRKYGWVMLTALFFGGAVFQLLKKKDAVREKTEKVIFCLPIIGSLLKKNNSACFARNLSTLLEAGVPILQALKIVEKSVESVCYRKVICRAVERVSGGTALSLIMKDSRIFPPIMCHMAEVGEETGCLDKMMERAAEYYEEEVAAATEQTAAALEPVIIIIMALIVVSVIAAVFWPILSLYGGMEYL